MPGLVPGIHVFLLGIKGVDGRERRQVYVVCAKQTTMPGHDEMVDHGRAFLEALKPSRHFLDRDLVRVERQMA